MGMHIPYEIPGIWQSIDRKSTYMTILQLSDTRWLPTPKYITPTINSYKAIPTNKYAETSVCNHLQHVTMVASITATIHYYDMIHFHKNCSL